MSTPESPTPNELPTVLGVGSSAIEAAARVKAYLDDFAAKYGSASGFVDSVNVDQSNALYADDLARLTALSAAYPLMVAQAKAEALREAADYSQTGPVPYGWNALGVASWLRARAATIEGKDS